MGFGGSGGGGNGAIGSATDVALNNPANNQVLTYDGSVGKWKNAIAASGSSELLVIKYASGQYPALPATKPAGVTLILFKGPLQPTSLNVVGGLPSYLGDGANQIMADYEYRDLV